MVDTFVEMLAPMGEIVEKKGTSCRRLVEMLNMEIVQQMGGVAHASFGEHAFVL